MHYTYDQGWTLVGLTSYGPEPCAHSQYSDVYTRVSAYRSFINNHVPIYTCSCHCPEGTDSGQAFTTINSAEECVYACLTVPGNACLKSTTYACIYSRCSYHSSYNHPEPLDT